MAKNNGARVSEVRRIFQKLYPNATRNEVTVFYHWLEDNGRDLLPHGTNVDAYQQLRSDLQGLWGKKCAPVKLIKIKRSRAARTERSPDQLEN